MNFNPIANFNATLTKPSIMTVVMMTAEWSFGVLQEKEHDGSTGDWDKNLTGMKASDPDSSELLSF